MHRFLKYSKGGSLTALLGLAGTRIAMNAITVTDLDPPENRKKGSHWANDNGTKFANPWPSFRDVVSQNDSGMKLTSWSLSLSLARD